MRAVLALASVVATLAAAARSPAQREPAGPAAPATADYVVLAAFGADDPFDAAAQDLATGRRARVLRFDPADLEPLREPLRAAAPRDVAIVIRPEQLDFDVQRRFLQLATELDDDPFVDFAFGWITGRTAADARALVARGMQRKPLATKPTYAAVCGGTERSMRNAQPFALRELLLDGLRLYCAGKQAHPDDGRDLAFLRDNLRDVQGRDAITWIGHGYPREVVGGPTFEELQGLALDGAVVLSVPCYTGVTNGWFETDWKQRVVRREEVPLDESFCLQLLRTGVVGYTAYLCPRPAGPELDTDLADLLCGSSLGDARRRDYDETVLGYLGFGAERLQLERVRGGAPALPVVDAVRDMMLEGATGGVLFGDPAVVPFAARPEAAPIAVEVERVDGGGLDVALSCPAMLVYTQCADQTARFGKQMAFKLHARVPLGDLLVRDVEVTALRFGAREPEARVVWAVEADHGERFLQLKVNWQREQPPQLGDVRAEVRVHAATDAADARHRGGHVERLPVRAERGGAADGATRPAGVPPRGQPYVAQRRDVATDAELQQIRARREVGEAALQAALDAEAALRGGADADAARAALERLAAFGSEGYRATCAIVEAGRASTHSLRLFEATWHAGDEVLLLALASRRDLPQYGDWLALAGLAVSDTPRVRWFLRREVERGDDAGRCQAAANALAALGDQELAARIADHVLQHRDGWSGVEPHLVGALARLAGNGGTAAREHLERIALDPRGTARDAAMQWLERVDPAAAKRIAAQRRDAERGSTGR